MSVAFFTCTESEALTMPDEKIVAELKSCPIITEYLEPTNHGGDFPIIDVLTHHLGLSTNSSDFINVLKFGCEHFVISTNQKALTLERQRPFVSLRVSTCTPSLCMVHLPPKTK